MEQIADILEKDPEKIEDIYHAVIESAPEYDLQKIRKRVSRKPQNAISQSIVKNPIVNGKRLRG